MKGAILCVVWGMHDITKHYSLIWLVLIYFLAYVFNKNVNMKNRIVNWVKRQK